MRLNFSYHASLWFVYTKVIVIVASQTFLLWSPITLNDKVSFNIACFKNFLHFSSIAFTIPGAQLKEAGYIKKL